MLVAEFARSALAVSRLWLILTAASAPSPEHQVSKSSAASVVQQTPPTVAAPTAVTPAPPLITRADEEIALLKQQNSDLKGSQSDLLVTVWSALAAVVVLTGALIGFGWYANFRLYERDKQLLKSELESFVALSSAQLKKDSENSFKQFESKSKLRTDRLRHDILIFRAEYAIESDSPSVAVTACISALELAIELKTEWRIRQSLQHLEEAIDAGGEFYEREIAETYGVLNKVPSGLAERAKAVASKLKTAKTMEEKSA